MEEVKKKIVKMGDEVVQYFLERDGKDISLNIKEDSEHYYLQAKSDVYISEYELEEIFSNYKIHRDLEYDFFWELVGENSEEAELELLFMLADDTKISYEDNILEFNIRVDK
ncbi:hypothetical protein [Oceanivirga miroungae]|uniref:Uncharacterized protein n=1 Tax=Oceanivirga miroungae TaxID=1130046 RepID=A0A6I8MDL8_9FUSO|nr:hypothetical protein [Oceanivirga miroungae]VWL85605.1 hypothetical protein OMES3154_00891 [Oceanivirga miroungae]